MDTHVLLLIGHIAGTVLGVGGATLVEVHLNMALKDGKMDETERAFMKKDFIVTRVGMAIAFVTGIGFIVEYILADQLFRLVDGVFWAKMAIFLIIVLNAYLLHKHKIGLYWGSAFSFVSWWVVMVLGMFLTNGIKFFASQPVASFFAVMMVYGVLVIAGAFILHKFREIGKKTLPPPPATAQ